MFVDLFIETILHLITPFNIFLITSGVIIGTVFGSVPGFTGSNTLAVFLPITIPLEADIAIVFLASLYVGSMYGGAIPAVLINTPGTTGATATVLDAYPMSKQGQPSKALGISIFASVIGGLMATIITIILLQPIGEIAFLFTNREIFVLGIFGLAAVSSALGEDTKKGMVAGLFGLFLATWAVDPTTAQTRMDFGFYMLYDEIPFIPVIIGLFAISELFLLINRRQISEEEDIITTYSGIIEGFKYVVNHPIATARGTFIGLGIGALPGAGASVSNFISWATAKASSANPDSFGKGNPDGIIASESANSATTTGSLIPTLTLGIPGSGSTAVMLAGLLLHGVQPGPELMQEFAFEANVIVVSLLFANMILLIIAFSASKYIVRVVLMPTQYLVPSIFVLTAIGAFVLRNAIFDIWWMFLFGIIGLIMRANGYALIPLVLGVILGPIIEGAFLRSMSISQNDPIYFFESTIAIILWVSIVLLLVSRPIYEKTKQHIRPIIFS